MMLLKKIVLLTLAIILSGCFGGAAVKKDAMNQVRTLAIGGVMIDRMAPDSANNNEILAAIMDRAHRRLAAGLARAGHWKLVDVTRNPHFSQISNLGIVSNQEINALYSSQFERNMASKIIKGIERSYQAKHLAARGYPNLPKAAIAPRDTRNQQNQNMAAIYNKKIKSAIQALGVDGLVFLNIRARTGHEGSIYIINQGRTNGTIYMAPTFLIINKQGEVIIDMGDPALDGLAESESGLPIYIGKGSGSTNFNNIDLVDPKGKTRQALFEMVDETIDDLLKDFSKMLKS